MTSRMHSSILSVSTVSSEDSVWFQSTNQSDDDNNRPIQRQTEQVAVTNERSPQTVPSHRHHDDADTLMEQRNLWNSDDVMISSNVFDLMNQFFHRNKDDDDVTTDPNNVTSGIGSSYVLESSLSSAPTIQQSKATSESLISEATIVSKVPSSGRRDDSVEEEYDESNMMMSDDRSLSTIDSAVVVDGNSRPTATIYRFDDTDRFIHTTNDDNEDERPMLMSESIMSDVSSQLTGRTKSTRSRFRHQEEEDEETEKNQTKFMADVTSSFLGIAISVAVVIGALCFQVLLRSQRNRR